MSKIKTIVFDFTFDKLYSVMHDLKSFPFVTSGLFRGPQFKKYDDYEMSITPNDEGTVIPPILGVDGWLDLDPPQVLLQNIVKLKMNSPTPIQRCACNVIKHKYDCIAIAETGQV